MIRYMLDTDICSYIMRERPIQFLEKFNTLSMEQFCISMITYAEFVYGIENSKNPDKHRSIVEQFVHHVDVLSWDRQAAEHFGCIRAGLKARGNTIGALDMMIAAHARSREIVLVTNNEKHFQRVANLKIENWVG